MDVLNGNTFHLLVKSMDVAALRQKVSANNIANADTPNFKRSYVKFEEYLQNEHSRKLSGNRTHAKHIPIGEADHYGTASMKVETDRSTSMNNNGNNVDIDAEMALLAKNQLNYNLLTTQIAHEISLIRKGIGGGR